MNVGGLSDVLLNVTYNHSASDPSFEHGTPLLKTTATSHDKVTRIGDPIFCSFLSAECMNCI